MSSMFLLYWLSKFTIISAHHRKFGSFVVTEELRTLKRRFGWQMSWKCANNQVKSFSHPLPKLNMEMITVQTGKSANSPLKPTDPDSTCWMQHTFQLNAFYTKYATNHNSSYVMLGVNYCCSRHRLYSYTNLKNLRPLTKSLHHNSKINMFLCSSQSLKVLKHGPKLFTQEASSWPPRLSWRHQFSWQCLGPAKTT